MQVLQHLTQNFKDIKGLNNTFVGTPPYPMIVLDNFLPKEIIQNLNNECQSTADLYWTQFTRNGSYMKECRNLSVLPVASDFVNQMNSALILEWLSELTGIRDLIPDPYIIGGGYSKSFTGDCLKIHTDFNWNEKLKLHRILSFIIYLTPDWDEDWGGDLQFTDFNREKVLQKISPKYNRAVIWRYHKLGFHGYPEPLTCPQNVSRNTFRLFYYYSNSTHLEDDRPHRSLYWYDQENKEPYDIPTRK